MKKILNKTKQKVEVCLTRTAEYCSSQFINDMNVFCGPSKHTVSSELYFTESTIAL